MSKHIKILGFGNQKILSNEEKIKAFFPLLLEKLGMRPLGNPSFFNVPLQIEKLNSIPFSDEGGKTINGFGYVSDIVLSTSHVALHCWELRKEFHLDIYSCRDFDKKEIKSFVLKYFECTKTKISDLSKFTKW